MTFLFLLNTLSAKLGGYLQNASMLIKLIPLLIIAIAGLFFGDTGAVLSEGAGSFHTAVTTSGWLAAFAPIAFAFDGWIVATSINGEIKNSKRNLPLALSISPIIILLAYVMYFVGITALLGPDTIMKQGDASAFSAAVMLLGEFGAKIVLIFVVISVLGTVNGITLGFIRMPYSLAMREMIPFSGRLKKENEALGNMPLNSSIFAYALSLFWMAIHYLTQKYGMKGDVSEIAIGVSYLNYIILYIAVIRLAKKGEIKGKVKGYLIPVLATVGSLVIISGSVTHPLFIYYFIICLAVILSGYFYYRKNKERIL
jgi:APA family basic amino acid/polyamine antiporter